MIFVTVGTQLTFDRMVRTVDQWAGEKGRPDVFAQIGEGAWKPEHIAFTEFIDPQTFVTKVREADLLVAHAGTGSILTALQYRKPIVIMPRRADLGEHRNDHQMATARQFAKLTRVPVAFSEAELLDFLNDFDRIKLGSDFTPHASDALIQAVREFIHQEK